MENLGQLFNILRDEVQEMGIVKEIFKYGVMSKRQLLKIIKTEELTDEFLEIYHETFDDDCWHAVAIHQEFHISDEFLEKYKTELKHINIERRKRAQRLGIYFKHPRFLYN